MQDRYKKVFIQIDARIPVDRASIFNLQVSFYMIISKLHRA